MPSGFWLGDGTTCFLKGVPGDASNPIRLPDNTIIEFLRTIPGARDDFNHIFPTLLPAERARLTPLAHAAMYVQPDLQKVEDDVQHKWNTGRIVPRGPGPAPVGYEG